MIKISCENKESNMKKINIYPKFDLSSLKKKQRSLLVLKIYV